MNRLRAWVAAILHPIKFIRHQLDYRRHQRLMAKAEPVAVPNVLRYHLHDVYENRVIVKINFNTGLIYLLPEWPQ